MKLTAEEKEICKKYSRRDKDGFVHCRECPLAVDIRYSLCKANLTKKRNGKSIGVIPIEHLKPHKKAYERTLWI